MAELAPIYLVSGEDAAKIDAWRRRVRERAAGEGGELVALDGDACEAAAVAEAAAALTLSSGRRYVLADGVQRWTATQVDSFTGVLADLPAETTLLLIARGKGPAKLAKAVEKAGGELRAYEGPKPWKLAGWAQEQAREQGLDLSAEGAKALVARVGGSSREPGKEGDPQQRILREVEKLALQAEGGPIGAEEVEDLTADAHESAVFALSDAVVAREGAASQALAEELRRQGETVSAIGFWVVRQLRAVHDACAALEAGEPESKVKGGLRMPPGAAKRTMAQAKRADVAELRSALCELADLEVATRGGGDLDEDTALTLTLRRATA